LSIVATCQLSSQTNCDHEFQSNAEDPIPDLTEYVSERLTDDVKSGSCWNWIQ